MKKVIDAVNESKSEPVKHDFNYVYVGTGANKSHNKELDFTYREVQNNQWRLVCTKDEFNQCVEDCSNNFGNKTMTDVKFEFHNNPIAHTITSSNILCCAETGRVVAVFYNESDLQAATGLIKKVELINGMAYQFDARNKTLHGVYCKYKDTLNIHQGHYFDAIICTNIQLLEVK